MTWRIERAVGSEDERDVKRLKRLLAEGWEPFAATQSNGYAFVYHLRKSDHNEQKRAAEKANGH